MGPGDPRGGTVDLGLGVREIADAGGRGRVVAVYRMAAYLRLPGGLCAMTTLAAPAGPLHLRVAVLPALRLGQPVRVARGGLALTGPDWHVGLDARTWVGALPERFPPPQRFRAQCPPPERVGAQPSDLAALARQLGGRGPGLTPYGDDVLAGALLAVRACRGPAATTELSAVANSVRTTDVAAAYLAWAARGQCIEPAHQWLLAVADQDAVAADRAADRLRRVGVSSGRGLLSGMNRAVGGLRGAGGQPARGWSGRSLAGRSSFVKTGPESA